VDTPLNAHVNVINVISKLILMTCFASMSDTVGAIGAVNAVGAVVLFRNNPISYFPFDSGHQLVQSKQQKQNIYFSAMVLGGKLPYPMKIFYEMSL